jgi:exosortase B
MSSSITFHSKSLPNWLQEWWPILLGLIILYVPTYYGLSMGVWRNEDQAHGPIILLLVLFLFWQSREKLIIHSVDLRWSAFGGVCFCIGLLCYVIGRSQGIVILEIGSQIPVLAGILLLTRGQSAFMAMLFPLFFMIFMIPLPGFFLDAITMPMKMAVSYMVENVLFYFGYPIARTGVILQIGPYQLLVADACAGMHTLVSLEALGLLYLKLVKHNSIFRNITLAILIVPISFTANVIRVMVLTLVTYYYGDAAGQGFVHGFAGMMLFIVALVLIMGVDSALQYFDRRWLDGRLSLIGSTKPSQ